MENSVLELLEKAHATLGLAINQVEVLDRDSISYDIGINDLLMKLDEAELAIYFAISELENVFID